MTKKGLIGQVHGTLKDYIYLDVTCAVNVIFESMAAALTKNERVEIRGFGSFTARRRQSKKGRNPKTGETVDLKPRRMPFFTVGKELKDRINGV